MIDIPINAIRIDHLEVGQYTPLEEKETHQKVIPETIMAFVKHIVFYTIQKASGFCFVFFTITTMRTSKVKKVITFLLK